MVPTRVASHFQRARHAETWGLRPAWPPDFANRYHDGRPWGLSEGEVRAMLWEEGRGGKAPLSNDSPMCTDLPAMMHTAWARMQPLLVERRMGGARMHLAFFRPGV